MTPIKQTTRVNEGVIIPIQEIKGNRPDINAWYVVRLVSELGITIAIPLVIFLLIGIYIDSWLKTKIIFTLLGMGLALLLSSISIYRKLKDINDRN